MLFLGIGPWFRAKKIGFSIFRALWRLQIPTFYSSSPISVYSSSPLYFAKKNSKSGYNIRSGTVVASLAVVKVVRQSALAAVSPAAPVAVDIVLVVPAVAPVALRLS